MIESRLGAPALDLYGDLASQVVAIRRYLHAHPELGFEEFETATLIEDALVGIGLRPVRVAGTGVYADIEGALPGGRIGYRADIDALPIHDAKLDVPYRSTRAGVAHLCGHDAHTAVGLGVARLLVEQRERLRGTVRVFFQPNEEGSPSGAPRMIEAGVLDGLDAVFAIHVDPTLRTGQFGLIRGPVTASADLFEISVQGPATGHSARPHLVIDTVWLATSLAQHLYTLAGRVTDSRSPSVLTICRFEAGEAFNVIPRTVTFGGTLRCLESDTRAHLRRVIEQVVSNFGEMHGARIEVRFFNGSPPVLNDPVLVDRIETLIRERYGDDAFFLYPKPSMGAEDFGSYTERIPGLFVRVGTQEGPRTAHHVHDSLFDLDEKALPLAASLMSEALLRFSPLK